MNRIVTISLAVVLAMSITQSAFAQPGRILTPEQRAERQMQQAEQLLEELREPSPLPALNSVWIEELT